MRLPEQTLALLMCAPFCSCIAADWLKSMQSIKLEVFCSLSLFLV